MKSSSKARSIICGKSAQAVKLPLLRKDFIIDERQILEAIEWGADAILLIVAILDDAQLKHFHPRHEAAAWRRSSRCMTKRNWTGRWRRARLIGVNNRDLKTFKVDLATTERLAARLQSRAAADHTGVAGRRKRHSHPRRCRAPATCGARAILVGESLMRDGDIHAKTAIDRAVALSGRTDPVRSRIHPHGYSGARSTFQGGSHGTPRNRFATSSNRSVSSVTNG